MVGYAALSRGLKRLLSLLRLPHFTLGSLRAGGATESFRQHRNLGYARFHSCWSRLSRYVQEAMAASVLIRSAPEAEER
eukprot:10893599-Heterocapsa_arctica.AAC.1